MREDPMADEQPGGWDLGGRLVRAIEFALKLESHSLGEFNLRGTAVMLIATLLFVLISGLTNRLQQDPVASVVALLIIALSFPVCVFLMFLGHREGIPLFDEQRDRHED